MNTNSLSTKEKATISCVGVFTLYSSYFILISFHKGDFMTTLCQSIGAAMSMALLGLLANLMIRHR